MDIDLTGVLAAIGAAYAAVRTAWMAIKKLMGR